MWFRLFAVLLARLYVFAWFAWFVWLFRTGAGLRWRALETGQQMPASSCPRWQAASTTCPQDSKFCGINKTPGIPGINLGLLRDHVAISYSSQLGPAAAGPARREGLFGKKKNKGEREPVQLPSGGPRHSFFQSVNYNNQIDCIDNVSDKYQTRCMRSFGRVV